MAAPRSGVHHGAMRTRNGFTLLELVVATALTGLLLAMAAPAASRWHDGAAVRAARDEVAAALAWTRIAAAAHGGASLWLDSASVSFWTATADGGATAAVDLGDRYGVWIQVGSDRPVEIRYDALGLGRIGSRTVVVRRGGAERGLTVAAYGRVRRW